VPFTCRRFSFESVHGRLRIHPMTAMHDRLELNCLVCDDDPSHIFTIEIANTKTVSALKRAIKDENEHLFRHVDAKTLVLWKVSFPAGPSLEENLSNVKLVGEGSLLPLDELSEVFPEPPVRKHLDIVVGRPPIGAFNISDLPPVLELNCLVSDDEPSHIFTIEIANFKNVSALKKAIKDEKKHKFQHVDADNVTLWKVSFPVNESLQENVGNVIHENSLSPVDRLSTIFSDVSDGCLHVVVRSPTIAAPHQASPNRPESHLTSVWNQEQGSIIDGLRMELKQEIDHHQEEMEALKKVTLLIMPMHVRVLLDLTYQRILKDLKFETWEDLRQNRNIPELADTIFHSLDRFTRPSYETLVLVCLYSNVRRDSFLADYGGFQYDVKDTLNMEPICSEDRCTLANLYTYAFDEEF